MTSHPAGTAANEKLLDSLDLPVGREERLDLIHRAGLAVSIERGTPAEEAAKPWAAIVLRLISFGANHD